MFKDKFKCTIRESSRMKGKVIITSSYILPENYLPEDVEKYFKASQALLFRKAAEWIESNPVATILSVLMEPVEFPCGPRDDNLTLLTLYFER